jgi:hypothetical protein
MPAPLPPFELPSSLTTERGGIRMSLGEHSTPTEFLGEADDDPLVPLSATECTYELSAATAGGVDVETMLAVVIDVEVRAELSARYNVALIDYRGEFTAAVIHTLVGIARRKLAALGVDANSIEETKREYAEPFERELRRRLGR